MFRHCIFFLFAAAATLTAAAQPATDTLTAGVFPPKPTVLKGATRDLALLDVRLITLRHGQSFDFPRDDSADHLLIVKDDTITIALDPPNQKLRAGGIALFPSGYRRTIFGSSHTKASFYLFSFRSRTGSDSARYRRAPPGAIFVANWSALVMKPTPKGESRAIFSQPTAWLKNINMHATTLNPGEISHPQHMHRAEEILLIRSGNVRMHIADGYIPAKGGDLVFLPSGVPHDLENGKGSRTEYFALQWMP